MPNESERRDARTVVAPRQRGLVTAHQGAIRETHCGSGGGVRTRVNEGSGLKKRGTMNTATTRPTDAPAAPNEWGTATLFHEPALLAGFKPRPTDVLITTAPKAGTTWMQQILYQLRCGGDANFRNIFEVVPWLEYPQPGRTVDAMLGEYEAMAAPRIFKTHCTYEQTPGMGTVRVVLTSRDPRDCCVSYYHHMSALAATLRDDLGIAPGADFDALFERWLTFGAWYRNVRSWWPHRQDSKVLWLRYEDIKRDLEAGIETILRFLGWSLRPDQKATVLELCSFAWMKQHGDKFAPEPSHLHTSAGNHVSLVRKGAVGDYRSLLTAQHEQRILDKARQELEPECLRYLGIGDL